MAIEERLSALESDREINRLFIRYCDLVDSGKSDQISTEFYAEDIVADYHFNILNGRSEIHDFYVSGMGIYAESFHSVSNVVIKSCDGDVAEVSSVIIAFHWHGGAENTQSKNPEDFGLVVRSDDRLLRTPEGWRVTKRHARALGPSFALKETDLVLRRKD